MTETIIRVASTDVRHAGTASTSARTLASPTVGGSTLMSLWRVRMSAGSAGPRHVVDSEQIWTLLSGEASVRSEADEFIVDAGDTVIMPAGAVRTVVAVSDCEFLVCGSPSALATIPGTDAEPVSPPWVL
jgi:quercetin dioxygenase-like cupin family protein